ncbi:hypothetical protein J4Q44_G00262180, partial [Coregonus suidteri]
EETVQLDTRNESSVKGWCDRRTNRRTGKQTDRINLHPQQPDHGHCIPPPPHPHRPPLLSPSLYQPGDRQLLLLSSRPCHHSIPQTQPAFLSSQRTE